MDIFNDPIARLAYTKVMVSCEADGCAELFQQSLETPATDPVEAWAEAMAKVARAAGWSVGVDGQVLCPTHGHIRELGSE